MTPRSDEVPFGHSHSPLYSCLFRLAAPPPNHTHTHTHIFTPAFPDVYAPSSSLHHSYYERTGAINQTVLLRYLHPKDLVWRHIRQQQMFCTRTKQKSKELGKLVEQQIIISDLKGLSLWPNRRAFAVFKETVRIDQA